MLTIAGLQTGYGHIEAFRGRDLELRTGASLMLIGAHGAGQRVLLM